MGDEEEFHFKKRLLQIKKALTTDEVEALVFFCIDLLDRDLSGVSDASTLFLLLMDQGILSAENQDLLAGLIHIIRPSLIRELGLNTHPSETRTQISTYRAMLYNLSENITKEELKHIKFLLTKQLPRKKLEENVTTLEIFLEMERKDLLSDTNLILLVKIIRQVCPMLEKKIHHFETMKGKCEGAPRLRSTSVVDNTRKQPHLQKTERPSSCEISGPGLYSHVSPICPSKPTSLQTAQWHSLHPSITVMDEPRGLATFDASLLQGLSPLNTNMINQSNLTKEKVPHMAIVSSGDVQLGTEHSQTQNAQEEALGSYSMMGKQRGFCLIINNNDFSKSLKQLNNRRGTDIDEEGLVKVFTWLGFVTEVARDCTRKQILQVLQKLRIRDHREMDCLVCCVLSHGLERGIYGVDGVEVKLSELQEPFNGHQCSFLKNKPKLFFIQACQGNKEQRPVDIQADCVWHSSVCSDAMVPKDSIPILADFLLGMATVPQFASFRDPTQGTWFIQSLCKNLVHMVPKGCDLVSILTKVNADVSEMTDPGGLRKQMPQPEFSLRKRVVFPIPNDPAPKLFQKQDT